MVLILLVSAVLSASPVQTTRCQQVLNEVQCTTDAPSSGIDWSLANPDQGFDHLETQRALQEAQRRRAQNDQYRRNAIAQQEAAEAQRRSRAAHEQVGKLLSLKRCDEALSLALTAGEIDLANSVKQFCKPERE